VAGDLVITCSACREFAFTIKTRFRHVQTIKTNNYSDPFREFPEPVKLPEAVDVARATRTSRLVGVSTIGVAVRLLIIGIEFAGFWVWGYSVLLVDAVASLADVVASVAIIIAIKIAERPPDEDHPFGHGRFEPLAGMQMGILICMLGGGVIAQQFFAVFTEATSGNVNVWVAVIPLSAAVIFELICRMILRIGRREHSTALISEAYHYRVDGVTSLLAAAGLLVASAVPQFSNLVDHLGAMLLAAIMLALGATAVWQNVHQLLDRVPDPKWFERVRASAEKVEGVLDIEKVRMQCAGPDTHVDIDIEVDPRQTVSEAHVITQHVRAQIQTDWPAVREVVVHVEPYYAGDH
jgi:cation diffusion facilitator family transporter